MEGGLCTFKFIEHLLIELLSGTQTCELNLHILGTRQFNHTLSQICNSHGFTHIKHEYLTAITLRTSFKHQLTSLRYQHKEAYDSLVCHRHRTTILNLFAEQRDDGTITTQHIAKTSGDKLCLGSTLLLQVQIQCLYIDFANTLRATHHVGRIHSLICGYHHKFLCSVLHTHVSYHFGAIYIIQYCLARIILHHWYMLIRCSVEHVIWTECTKHSIHSMGMTDARHQSLRWDVGEFVLHHQPNIVLRSFCLVYQHQGGRFQFCHLTHDFRTDGTSTTCDQHTLTFQEFAYGFHIHSDFRTRQQLFNAHLAHLHVTEISEHPIIFSCHLNGTLSHQYLCPCTKNYILNLLIITELFGSIRRHQDSFNLILTDDGGDVLIYRVHFLAHNPLMLGVLIVGDESFHCIFSGACRHNTFCQPHTF